MKPKKLRHLQAPVKGSFLISEPFLADPNFKRSIVLLTEHTKEGYVGFIMNKPTILTLNEVIAELPPFDAPVFLGGPVEPEILNFIHRSPLLKTDSISVGNGIFWGGNFEELKFLMESGELDPNDFRFFLGYSGWGTGQLDAEMKIKSWYVSQADADLAFTPTTDTLWQEVLKSMGQKYSIISNYPENPSWN